MTRLHIPCLHRVGPPTDSKMENIYAPEVYNNGPPKLLQLLMVLRQ